jgi:hypothetical protein
MEDEMKKQLAVALTLVLFSIGIASNGTAQNTSTQPQSGTRRVKPAKVERHRVRREFEAIFAKQVADYKAQFEAVKRGEKLKPTCAPDFVLKRPNGTIVTCEQITAERQARFERIKTINFLEIEIGNIEITGNGAVVFTTQRFSRVVPDENGRDRTIVTAGTVHKEFWVKTEKGWESKGFEEFKQGTVTVDGQTS